MRLRLLLRVLFRLRRRLPRFRHTGVHQSRIGQIVDGDFDGIPDNCSACPADFNHSGTVDAADLGVLLGSWGGTANDLTGDGTVNAADLAILLGAWGACS